MASPGAPVPGALRCSPSQRESGTPWQVGTGHFESLTSLSVRTSLWARGGFGKEDVASLSF